MTERTVTADTGIEIHYILEKKHNKNLYLRVRPDGTVYVTVPFAVSGSRADDFVRSKASFIAKAQGRQKKCTNLRYRDMEPSEKRKAEAVCRLRVQSAVNEIYPRFERQYDVKYPQIVYRWMTNTWGNCRPDRGILTFNNNLFDKPDECIEFVVMHEFVHFLYPDHQKGFYDTLTSMMPDWKDRRRKLL